MRTSKLRIGVLCGFVGVFFLGQAAFGAATATLKAVKKNNVAITPTTDVSGAVAGDIYDVDIFLIGWNGLIDLARGYNFRIAGVEGTSNVNGSGPGGILPLGWNAPILPIGCTTNNDCLAHAPYVTCQAVGAGGTCVGPGHHPEQGAFVTTSRPDFLLAGLTPIGGIGTPNLNYVYGFTAQESDGAFDDGVTPRYAGTLKLVIETGACGDYVWRTVAADDPNYSESQSFLIDETPQGNTTPLVGVPLTIHTAACLAGITATIPPVCAIDAQYPNDPNNAATRFGFQGINHDTLVLTFSNDPGTLTAASFQMSTVPTGVGVPVISNVQKNGTQVTLTFDRVIPSTRWTCVKALFGEQDVACIGALGADTDASRQSGASDTQALIDALDGTPSLQIWQTDLDRSGTFTPIDILASIDLLNGAGALNAFNGLSLSACPQVGIP